MNKIEETKYGLGTRFTLWWGKLRRVMLRWFRPGYIKSQMKVRNGECARCGACCKLGMICLFLKKTEAGTMCKIHTKRPKNCSAFPIDERDIADRNKILPGIKCGYSFDPAEKKL